MKLLLKPSSFNGVENNIVGKLKFIGESDKVKRLLRFEKEMYKRKEETESDTN